jgi:hypothetical protein
MIAIQVLHPCKACAKDDRSALRIGPPGTLWQPRAGDASTSQALCRARFAAARFEETSRPAEPSRAHCHDRRRRGGLFLHSSDGRPSAVLEERPSQEQRAGARGGSLERAQ